MSGLRFVVVFSALLCAPVAFAKAPAGQGRACDTKSKCDAGLTCVAKHDGKSTCEMACAANAKCPEDQRCVKDGAQNVCRPINDGIGL
jgi:hypothetical protein